MSKFCLSNKGYVGLGIYLGFKSSYRQSEMAYHNINYNEVVDELTKVGLIKNGKIQTEQAKQVFSERFPNVFCSQVHVYKHILDL